MLAQIIIWGSVALALAVALGGPLLSWLRQPRAIALEGRVEQFAEPLRQSASLGFSDESQQAFAELRHLNQVLQGKGVSLEQRKQLLDPLLPFLIVDPAPPPAPPAS